MVDELLEQFGHPGSQIHEEANETAGLRYRKGFRQGLQGRRFVVLRVVMQRL